MFASASCAPFTPAGARWAVVRAVLVSVVACALQYSSGPRGLSMIRTRALVLLTVLVALFACACGDGEPTERRSIPQSPTPVASVSPTMVATLPPDPPTELRVAFINLAAPLPLDPADPVLDDTYDERIAQIVAELKAFDPDIVGFNEASATKAHGSVRATLVKELNMEFMYARANPWFPGQTKEQSDELAKQVGFDEGELILVKSDRYPIVKVEPLDRGLSPRTSESGERRTALHVVIKGPDAVGDIDIYLTHLTGGGERVREAQAEDLVEWMTATRGTGPAILMGDMSDVAGSATFAVYTAAGFEDIAPTQGFATCCRLGVLGEQDPPAVRTDVIMTDGWQPISVALWGDKAKPRPDGTPLYPSDHNGLMATFSVTEAPPKRTLPVATPTPPPSTPTPSPAANADATATAASGR